LSEIRQRRFTSNVLTGRGDDDTYSRARELGAAQLLTKPVERDLLIKAIDAELNSDQPRSSGGHASR
jgi:DNA-binding response OmpR family regulator